MGNHILKIAPMNNFTHDVLRIVVNKPERLDFEPRQAAHIATNKSCGLKEESPHNKRNI